MHRGAYCAWVVHIAPSWCTSTPYTVVVVYNVPWVHPHRQTDTWSLWNQNYYISFWGRGPFSSEISSENSLEFSSEFSSEYSLEFSSEISLEAHIGQLHVTFHLKFRVKFQVKFHLKFHMKVALQSFRRQDIITAATHSINKGHRATSYSLLHFTGS